jgi:hypothetical protein
MILLSTPPLFSLVNTFNITFAFTIGKSVKEHAKKIIV